jgi:hypothetical protein
VLRLGSAGTVSITRRSFHGGKAGSYVTWQLPKKLKIRLFATRTRLYTASGHTKRPWARRWVDRRDAIFTSLDEPRSCTDA